MTGEFAQLAVHQRKMVAATAGHEDEAAALLLDHQALDQFGVLFT